jgi:hypothetical protein
MLLSKTLRQRGSKVESRKNGQRQMGLVELTAIDRSTQRRRSGATPDLMYGPSPTMGEEGGKMMVCGQW